MQRVALAAEQSGDDIDKNIAVLKNWKEVDEKTLIIVTVRFGEKQWDYDFAKNTVTEVAQ